MKRPLINTQGTHTGCNLRCRHCAIALSIDTHPEMRLSLSFDELVKDLRDRYAEGARIAYFEGGETTIWRDGDRDLGDLIDAAKDIGYYNVGYTTNGTTGRIFTNSDVISVSLDGPRDAHDYVRGKGAYDKLMHTLGTLEFDGQVYANTVLQKGNLDKIRETAQIVRDNPRLAGIIFNFLTPPPYEIMPSHEEKLEAVSEIRRLKEEGFPILNSKKGLELLATEDWEDRCPKFMSAFILPDGSHKMGCHLENTPSCKNCGYAAVREFYLVSKGSLSTVFELSSIFAMGKNRNSSGPRFTRTLCVPSASL